MTHPVPQLIRSAIQHASHRAQGPELAAAILSALRRLHHILDEAGGTNLAQQFVDGPVSNEILERNLRHIERHGAEPAPVPLPAAPSAGPATTIMLDAVDSGLLLNNLIPGNSGLPLLAPELTTALLNSLGGTPDAAGLLSLLRNGLTEGEFDFVSNGPVVQRLH